MEVHYRMHNAGGKVQQDFFFPVERWAPEEGQADAEGGKAADLEGYRLTVDGAELKWQGIEGTKSKRASADSAAEESPGATLASEEPKATADEQSPDSVGNEGQEDSDLVPTIKQWKKSVIPFAANEGRRAALRVGIP